MKSLSINSRYSFKPGKLSFMITLAIVLLLLVSCSNRKYGYLTRRVKANKHHTVQQARKSGYKSGISSRSKESTLLAQDEVLTTVKPLPVFCDTVELTSLALEVPVIQTNADLKSISLIGSHPVSSDALEFNQRTDGVRKVTSANKVHFRERYNDKSFLALSGGILLSLAFITFLFKKRTRQIAEWASRRKILSRTIYVASRIFIAASGFMAGIFAQHEGYAVSDASVFALSGVMVLAALSYPSRKRERRSGRGSFLWRKILDMALVFTGAGLLFTLGNVVSQTGNPGEKHYGIQKMYQESFQDAPISAVDKGENTGPVAHPYIADDAKVLLTLLIIAAYVFLFYGTGVLACELSCAGQDGAATMVILLGWFGGAALAIWGLIALWRS